MAKSAPKDDIVTVDIVQRLIDMNMRSELPTRTEIDFMLEAARLDHQMLGALARNKINKMGDADIGKWFKYRIKSCVNRSGTGPQKNKIRGIAKEQGWLA